MKEWVIPPEQNSVFVAQMEQVLDVYKLPYDRDYPVVCMVNVFMASEPLAGKCYIEVMETKTKKEWAFFIEKIAAQWYGNAKNIRLIMNNLKIHSPAALYEVLAKAKAIWDRLEFIYTPVHGSWLNMAEIKLHVLNGQCLNRPLDAIEKVKAEVQAWQQNRNNQNKKINLQFSNNDARIKLKKLYPTLHS